MDPFEHLRDKVDEALQHVTASRELRSRVLQRAALEASTEPRPSPAQSRKPGRFASFTAGAAMVMLVWGAMSMFEHLQAANLPASQGGIGTDRRETSVQSMPPSPSPAWSPSAQTAVLTPGYVPDDYAVKQVVSTLSEDSGAPVLTLRFASADRQFELVQSKRSEAAPGITSSPEPGTGRSNVMRITPSGDILMEWHDGEYLYTIKGSLSQKEAQEIASSIQSNRKEDIAHENVSSPASAD